MGDENITSKEFYEAIDDLKESFYEEQSKLRKEFNEGQADLRKDVQGLREVLYNGVKSTAKENKEELGEVQTKLDTMNSRLDKNSGGRSMLKTIGAGMLGATSILGTFVYVLYRLGAFAHWG